MIVLEKSGSSMGFERTNKVKSNLEDVGKDMVVSNRADRASMHIILRIVVFRCTVDIVGGLASRKGVCRSST